MLAAAAAATSSFDVGFLVRYLPAAPKESEKHYVRGLLRNRRGDDGTPDWRPRSAAASGANSLALSEDEGGRRPPRWVGGLRKEKKDGE